MTIVPVLKQVVRIVGRIDRKYNINKIFIDKHVPPHLRGPARKLVDIAGTLGGGYGLVKFVESLYASDSPGNGASVPYKKFTPARKPYKTRGGFSRRYGTRRAFCPNPDARNRYSNSRRYKQR